MHSVSAICHPCTFSQHTATGCSLAENRAWCPVFLWFLWVCLAESWATVWLCWATRPLNTKFRFRLSMVALVNAGILCRARMIWRSVTKSLCWRSRQFQCWLFHLSNVQSFFADSSLPLAWPRYGLVVTYHVTNLIQCSQCFIGIHAMNRVHSQSGE